MDQDIKRTGLTNLVVLLAIATCSLFLGRIYPSLAAQPALVFLGLGVLVSTISYFQMRLEEAEANEKLEFEELRKSASASALFSQEIDTYPAARARAQFERWFIPGFSLFLMALQGSAAWIFWQKYAKTAPAAIQGAAIAMALYGIFALILFLTGKYSAGLARLGSRRLLRPGASYIMLAAYLSFLVTAGIAAHELGFPNIDLYIARALSALAGLTALETLINLVFELYRPRVKGAPARLLYESRLIGLLGQPEGLITTAAQALDYQFGFKVSGTWFYRFLEKSISWIILLQTLALFLSTGIAIIEPHEQALLERFGRPAQGREILQPGFHLKWPWPIDKIHRYRTREVQSFTIGLVPDPEHDRQKSLVWTRAHSKEELNFIVASREQVARSSDPTGSADLAVPVNLLTVSIPVQYQIYNLHNWATLHADAGELLQKIASREIVRYLVNIDIDELMTTGRGTAAGELRKRVQAQADALKLGAEILHIGLQDIHPPIGSSQVKVAEAYEAVIGALQERETNVLAARAYFAEKVPLAQAEATNLIATAVGDSAGRTAIAAAESAIFASQLAAHRTAPGVYTHRGYLETLSRSITNARKYVLATTNTTEIINLNLEDKVRPDLLDVMQPRAEKP